jgi:hypothetical protein
MRTIGHHCPKEVPEALEQRSWLVDLGGRSHQAVNTLNLPVIGRLIHLLANAMPRHNRLHQVEVLSPQLVGMTSLLDKADQLLHLRRLAGYQYWSIRHKAVSQSDSKSNFS